MFLVVSVLYVVCVVTRYLLTPAHTKPATPHTCPPHPPPPSSPPSSPPSVWGWIGYTSPREWWMFHSSKSIHSIHYHQSRPDHGSASIDCLRDWIENWKTFHKLLTLWSVEADVEKIMTEFHCWRLGFIHVNLEPTVSWCSSGHRMSPPPPLHTICRDLGYMVTLV